MRVILQLWKIATDYFHRYPGLRFLIVGAGNTLFAFFVYSTFILLGFSILTSLIVCYISGIIFNFFSYGKVVFKDISVKRAPRFVLVYLAILAINYYLTSYLVGFVGGKIVAQAILVVPMAILSYLLMSIFVYKKPSKNGI